MSVRPGSNAGAPRFGCCACVSQLMSRRLSSPAMGQVEGMIEDAAARCAVKWKASPSARRVCFELPWRSPGPFTFYHRCALVVPAGSHPPQLTGTVDSCLLDGIWAASTDISLLPVVSVCARWMLGDVQWFRTRTLMNAYGSSAVHSNALFELDPLHASDQYDPMRDVYRATEEMRGTGRG